MAYGVVETTKISGRCFSFYNATEDIENGFVVKKGAPKQTTVGAETVDEREIYTVSVPAVTDKVYLVANPAWSYDDSRAENQNEDKFINKAGVSFRGYALFADDKFGVSDYTITPVDASTAIAVGDYIGVDGTTMKLTDLGTSAPDLTARGFVGIVREVESYGVELLVGAGLPNGLIGNVGKKVVIEVIQNEDV